MTQTHLSQEDTINYGSYYTPEWLVDKVYTLLRRNVGGFGDYYILDTSCGYGGFLRGKKALGADIDADAVKTARDRCPGSICFHHNSLLGVSRSQYGIKDTDRIIIVGNPPYNDTASLIRSGIKEMKFERDRDIASRDMGISFLRSYSKLRADYVCVLHPLSYLIKKKNFESLKEFGKNYRLTDSVIISSGAFSGVSKSIHFPIIIGLYKRCASGMTYDYINAYNFRAHEGGVFSLKDYDTVDRYIAKYPNHSAVGTSKTVAHFYTMRDINALSRTKTFIDRETVNTIRVTEKSLFYYCYIDIFKEYIPHIPYYFGNSNVMIDCGAANELKEVFIYASLKKYPYLNAKMGIRKKYNSADSEIGGYFRRLLGSHYIG
jgi:hypothetical protein